MLYPTYLFYRFDKPTLCSELYIYLQQLTLTAYMLLPGITDTIFEPNNICRCQIEWDREGTSKQAEHS